MIKLKLLSAVVTSVALVVGAAGAATADYRNSAAYVENGYGKTCYGQDNYNFKLTYNSNNAGAERYFGYSEGNFGDQGNAGSPQGGTNPAYFCEFGNGANQPTKNNAAFAQNSSYDYSAFVYFNKWWVGAYDYVPRRDGINLANTKNENASFKWV